MTFNRQMKRIALSILVITWLLSACSGLTQSDKPVATTWWLEPYAGTTQAVVADSVLPVVVTLTAVPGLDTKQILTLSRDAELKPFAGARWADDSPELLRSLITRSLQASGRFDVRAYGGRGSNGCELQLELQEFFAELDSNGQTTGVSVALDGRFQCDSSGVILIDSRASVPVTGTNMSSIVSAFQSAIDQVLRDILEQMK